MAHQHRRHTLNRARLEVGKEGGQALLVLVRHQEVNIVQGLVACGVPQGKEEDMQVSNTKKLEQAQSWGPALPCWQSDPCFPHEHPTMKRRKLTCPWQGIIHVCSSQGLMASC